MAIWVLKDNLTRYRQDVGQYPTPTQGLEALVQRPQNARNWTGAYLYGYKRLPKDPWSKAYHYESPAKHEEFDLYSLGADNAEGGERENKDIVSWR